MTGDEVVAALSEIATLARDSALVIASSGLNLAADFALAEDVLQLLTQAGPILKTINFQPGYGPTPGFAPLGKIGAGR